MKPFSISSRGYFLGLEEIYENILQIGELFKTNIVIAL